MNEPENIHFFNRSFAMDAYQSILNTIMVSLRVDLMFQNKVIKIRP